MEVPDEVQLLHKFFSTLAAKFDASLATRGEKLSGVVNKYADVLSPIPVGGSAAAQIVKSFTSERSKADLDELKSRIEEILRKSNKRVVVIMDDIDRLDKEEVQALFRLVKLSADFPNTGYILAFDEQRVAEALADKYGSVDAGHNFLEKIVQLPLHLPPASSKSLRALAVEGIDSSLKLAEIEMTEEQKERFAKVFDKAFLHRIATPRLAKRFANGLTFALPITRGETDPVDSILLEAVRTFYPRLYKSIRDNDDVYMGTVFDALSGRSKDDATEHASKVIENALAGLNEQDKKSARVVIQELFPRTGAGGMFGAGAYGADYDSEWAKDKRIAAKDYFPRYFNYGLPPDDISDRELRDFLEEIPRKGVDYVIAKIREFTSNGRAALLIQKLRTFEDSLPAAAAKPLALGIAMSGDALPLNHPIDRFFGLGAYAQASVLMRVLIESLREPEERESLALAIADAIRPLPFGYEYSSRMRPMKRKHGDIEKVAVVSEECESEIRKRLATRITREAAEEPLEDRYPLDAQNLYRFWFVNDEEAIRKHLERRIRSHPEQAATFIAAVLGIYPNIESDEEFDLPEQEGWYELICKMVDPEIIMSALKQTFSGIDGNRLNHMNATKMSGAERAARWFAHMYNRQRRKSEDAPAGESAP